MSVAAVQRPQCVQDSDSGRSNRAEQRLHRLGAGIAGRARERAGIYVSANGGALGNDVMGITLVILYQIFYQIFTRFSGARNIPSPGFTSNAV